MLENLLFCLKRNDLKSYKKRGEAGSVDVAKLPEQREHLKSILEGVTFLIATKQLCFGKWNLEQHLLAPVSGKKLLKDRVSILATCNATGGRKATFTVHK